jgi:hypothetical protein
VAGASCTISAIFTPTAAGVRAAVIAVVDNASNSPQSVPLGGNGIQQPGVSLSPSSLAFPSLTVGTSSPAQVVTLTNSGTASLTVTGVTVVGTNSADFSPTTNCTTVGPGLNCTISVVFTPSAAGTRVASLVVTDNAPGSPQSVALTGGASTGTGQFTVTANPTSATTFAGTAATYSLVVTPGAGFNSPVALSCIIPFALTRTTCTVAPASVTPDGIHPVSATVTVITAARTMAPPGPNFNSPLSLGPMSLPWLIAMFAMAILAVLTAGRQRTWVGLTIVMLFVLLWAGCGGGLQTNTTVTGTPAGTYTLTLTGTSGNVTNSTSVNLTVN